MFSGVLFGDVLRQNWFNSPFTASCTNQNSFIKRLQAQSVVGKETFHFPVENEFQVQPNHVTAGEPTYPKLPTLFKISSAISSNLNYTGSTRQKTTDLFQNSFSRFPD